MTVQELIDELNKIEDKTKIVKVMNEDKDMWSVNYVCDYDQTVEII